MSFGTRSGNSDTKFQKLTQDSSTRQQNEPSSHQPSLFYTSETSSSHTTSQELKKCGISFQELPSKIIVEEESTPKASSELVRTAAKELKIHFDNKRIMLTERNFGKIQDQNSNMKNIKCFTWQNRNGIEVEVINYGARIISIKFPDKDGVVEDVVLGFDTLEDYVKYERHFFGATIGRVTGPVENSTYVIDGKQYWISANDGKHHVNGGFSGLDKVIWSPVVCGSRVIFSHVYPEGSDDFTGELLIEISFELSSKNEFSIFMEAKSTKPTIINLSNLCYFNLAGQNGGVKNTNRHIVTINSSTHIEKGENGLPTGKINNSAFTTQDFQIPKLLKEYFKAESNDDSDQYLCINTDDDDDIRFVARALHVPSGRTLEIYSNQPCVRFTVGNEFMRPMTPTQIKSFILRPQSTLHELFSAKEESTEADLGDQLKDVLLLVQLYQKLKDLSSVNEDNYEDILDLFKKIQTWPLEELKNIIVKSELFQQAGIDFKFFVTAVLKAIDFVKEAIPEDIENVGRWSELKNILAAVSELFEKLNDTVMAYARQVSTNFNNSTMSTEQVDSTLKVLEQDLEVSMKISMSRKNTPKQSFVSSSSKKSVNKSVLSWLWDDLLENVLETVLAHQEPSLSMKKSSVVAGLRQTLSLQGGKVVGKKGAIYEKHTGFAFQTQNYPNAIYHKNFPNCILRPNETYQHKIVYKFWVQSGCPKKWLKRYEAS